MIEQAWRCGCFMRSFDVDGETRTAISHCDVHETIRDLVDLWTLALKQRDAAQAAIAYIIDHFRWPS